MSNSESVRIVLTSVRFGHVWKRRGWAVLVDTGPFTDSVTLCDCLFGVSQCVCV